MIAFTVPGAPQGKGRISLDRVREALSYDASTGVLRWLIDIGTRARAGRAAGNVCGSGYLAIGLGGVRSIPAHRIAWALSHGSWPELEVDHINGCKTDNRLVNLRLVTTGENHQNMRSARRDNATGVLGVSRRGNRFRAQIQVGGKKHWLGEHATLEQARTAYVQAKRQLHPKGTL